MFVNYLLTVYYPPMAFLQKQLSNMSSLNKYFKVIFYLNIMVSFHRFYKDKVNQDFYELNKISSDYIFINFHGLYLLCYQYIFFLAQQDMFNFVNTS